MCSPSTTHKYIYSQQSKNIILTAVKFHAFCRSGEHISEPPADTNNQTGTSN